MCGVEPDYIFRQFQDAITHFPCLYYSAEIVGAVPICTVNNQRLIGDSDVYETSHTFISVEDWCKRTQRLVLWYRSDIPPLWTLGVWEDTACEGHCGLVERVRQ